MYTIELGQISKRKNSTFVPADAAFTLQVQAALKEPTSDNQPVFLLSLPDNLFPYNYLKWGNWYYWISDVKRVRNGLFEVSCDLDVLATYKTNILNTTAFVMYDQTTNTEIVDSRLSANTTAVYRTNSVTGFTMFTSGFSIAVGIVGRNSAGIYLLTEQQANALLNNLTRFLDGDNDDYVPIPDPSDFSNIDDAAGALVHNLTVLLRLLISTGKAPDSIKCAYLLPVDPSKFRTTTETIYLGDYNTGITAPKVTATMRAFETVLVPIPWGFSDWRRNAPYTEILLTLPYAGTGSLPASSLIGVDAVNVECYVTVTGSVTYNIGVSSAGAYRRIMRCGGNCASQYLIGASNVNPLGVASSIVSTAGATAAGIAAGGLIGGAGAMVASGMGILNHLQQTPSSVGGAGGGAFTDTEIPYCTTISHDTNVSPDSIAATMGTPAFAQKLLSTLSGFVQTRNVSVSAPAEGPILDRINGLLDGGVYIE